MNYLLPKNGREWGIAGGLAAFAILGSIIASVVFADPHHASHLAWWDKVPAFWSVFGFLGCAIIIVVSKALGKWFLQKPEDWYDA